MRAMILLVVAACLLAGCEDDDYEIINADVIQAFPIHSSPTFQGYFYVGSDAGHHYFQARWKYRRDSRFKVSKADLAVACESPLGGHEIQLFQFRSQDSGYKAFAEIGEGLTVYYEP